MELAEGELPYAPIVGALRMLEGDTSDDDAGRVSAEALALFVAEPGPEDRSAMSVSGREGAQARLFARVMASLTDLSRDRGLMLVVEDLHWADRSTRDFLAFLVRNARRARIAVVVSYRIDELHRVHPLRPFVRELERAARVRRIELRPFTRKELVEQVTGILDTVPDPALVDRLLERSDGNPFFAEELLAASVSGDAPVPESLRDALLVRVEALPETAQSVLRVVAVAARPLDESLLLAVSGLSSAELGEALREAVGHHLLRNESSGPGYAFRHALLREAVYDDLLGGERRSLHLRLAQALSERLDAGASAAVAVELAYHWYAGREPARALPVCIQAGIAAEAVHAPAEALVHYARALEIWGAAAETVTAGALPLRRVEVARRAAEAADLCGEPGRAVKLARLVLALVDEERDPVATALAHERLGRYLWVRGHGEDALPEYQRAVELIPAEPPSEERALVLAAQGQVLMLVDRAAESLRWAEEAIAVARSVGAEAVEAHALNTLGPARCKLGDPDSGLEATEQARAIATRLGLVEELGRSYVNGSDTLDQAGRTDESILLAQEGVSALRELGAERRWGDFLRAEIGGRLFRTGRWKEAQTLLIELVAARPAGINGGIAYVNLAQLQVERGELAAAMRTLEHPRPFAAQAGGSQFAGPFYAAQATAEHWDGRPGAAQATIQDCLELTAGQEDAFFTARLYDLAARAGAELALRVVSDGTVRARELATGHALLERLDALLEQFTAVCPPRVTASRAACVAELSRIAGSDPDAWAQAERAWAACGDSYLSAYASWRRAEALLADDGRRASDPARRTAAEIAGRAYGVAAELGARPLCEQLEALARRARFALGESSDATESSEADAAFKRLELTPREREVLGLLAEGCTNHDIADRLFISHKTASAHVSRILAKLEVRNRAAAGAVAHRLGLTTAPPTTQVQRRPALVARGGDLSRRTGRMPDVPAAA